MFHPMSWDAITFALALAALPPATEQPTQATEPPIREGTPIIVTPPPTESERREELRDFTKQIVRTPKLRQPVARFLYPVCVQVLGLDAPEAEAIAQRIRDHARDFGIGSNDKPDSTPTVKVAFMAPEAGPPERWLTYDSPSIAHLSNRQRELVLAEEGPVRAWNRIVIRDARGQPFPLFDKLRPVFSTDFVPEMDQPYSGSDPIITAEITGAAVMVSRDAAHGFTLAQLADYATVRTLIETSAPSNEDGVPVPTILTLFTDAEPPAEMTSFDRALVAELYNASRNSSARRVYNDIARAAAQTERAAEAQPDALDQ